MANSLMPLINRPSKPPVCVVIAGPNGGGKTTFAKEFLIREARIGNFINADLIAGGLSPLNPDRAAVAAGKLFLKEIERLAAARADFAFETTLSGKAHAARLTRWKRMGYRVELIFLRLDSPELAIKRIAMRVRQGGHDVPKTDVIRRFARGLFNLESLYKSLADKWMVYDNNGATPVLKSEGP